MKLTIETSKLQTLINKSSKGAANNKYIDFTTWVNIKLKNNILTFITSDGSNFLYVRENDIQADDFDIIVPVDLFSKLVNKTTSANITLKSDDKSLKVIGNGEHSIPLPMDAEFDDPLEDFELAEKPTKTISKSIIQQMLTINKPSIATTMQNPQNTGYYIKDKVITTDSYRITCLHEDILKEPVLLTRAMVDLLNIIEDEEIEFYLNGKVVVFKSDKYTIYGYTLSGLEQFKIDAIQGLIDMNYNSNCILNKNKILSVLDRMLLFVDVNSSSAIGLEFKEDKITVTNTNNTSYEDIEYIENNNFKSFKCLLNINTLISQLNALNKDEFVFNYGNDNIVKFTVDGITQIMATLNE